MGGEGAGNISLTSLLGCGPEGVAFPWVQYNNACYMLVNNVKKTWEEARKHCGRHSVKLTSFYPHHSIIFIPGSLGVHLLS